MVGVYRVVGTRTSRTSSTTTSIFFLYPYFLWISRTGWHFDIFRSFISVHPFLLLLILSLRLSWFGGGGQAGLGLQIQIRMQIVPTDIQI